MVWPYSMYRDVEMYPLWKARRSHNVQREAKGRKEEMTEVALPDVSKSPVPLFRDRSLLSEEELTDPDYGLKQLEKINNGRYNIGIGCSKCHHCR